VQTQGCGALGSLACDAGNQARIAAAGGIDAVVGAMGAHRGVARVQKHGCAALRSLALNNADNQARIAAAGGKAAVAGAMSAHSGDADVWNNAWAARWSFEPVSVIVEISAIIFIISAIIVGAIIDASKK